MPAVCLPKIFGELYLRNLPGPDNAALAVARERDAQLTKPSGFSGTWKRSPTGSPPLDRAVAAGDASAAWRSLPAITALPPQGVSPFPVLR